MDVRILGPLEVWVAGRSLALGGTKQRAVLAMLVLHANQVVAIDHLVDGLWGQTPPDGATNVVQVYVSRLRKTLRAASPEGSAGWSKGKRTGRRASGRRPGPPQARLPAATGHRRAGPGPLERLADQGTQALRRVPELAAARLGEALRLWRGRPLAEFTDEPFAQAESARLAEQHPGRPTGPDRGRPGPWPPRRAGRRAAGAGGWYPLQEGLHRQLLLSLYRSGRQAEALEAYQRTGSSWLRSWASTRATRCRNSRAPSWPRIRRLDWTPPTESKPTVRPGRTGVPRGRLTGARRGSGRSTADGPVPGRVERAAAQPALHRPRWPARAAPPAAARRRGHAGGAGPVRPGRGGQDPAGDRVRPPVRRRLRPGVVGQRRAAGPDRRPARPAGRQARPAHQSDRGGHDRAGPGRAAPPAGWLLVFDNAERPQHLAPYQPGGAGHVLVTSPRLGLGARSAAGWRSTC